MSEIRFYHLKTQTLEEALPALLMKAYDNGNKRIVLRLPDTAAIEKMNTHPWTFHPNIFLPHGSAKDGHADRQPIWLTDQDENPNGASVLIAAGGAVANDLGGFDLICEMFADHEEDVVTAARARWKTYKDAGHNLTYWQQTANGGWEQKA